MEHAHEIMTFFWNEIVNQFKRTAIEGIIVQLVEDLNSIYNDSLINIKNLHDVHDSNILVH